MRCSVLSGFLVSPVSPHVGVSVVEPGLDVMGQVQSPISEFGFTSSLSSGCFLIRVLQDGYGRVLRVLPVSAAGVDDVTHGVPLGAGDDLADDVSRHRAGQSAHSGAHGRCGRERGPDPDTRADDACGLLADPLHRRVVRLVRLGGISQVGLVSADSEGTLHFP